MSTRLDSATQDMPEQKIVVALASEFGREARIFHDDKLKKYQSNIPASLQFMCSDAENQP